MPLFAFRKARKNLSARAITKKIRKIKSANALPELLPLEKTATQGSQQSIAESSSSSNSYVTENRSSEDSSIEIRIHPPPLSPKKKPLESKSRSSPSTPRVEDDLAAKMSQFSIEDLDSLLSQQAEDRISALVERDRAEASTASTTHLAPRPTRLKFELPITPPRSRSPAAQRYPRGRPRRSQSCDRYSTWLKKKKRNSSRWATHVGDSDEREQESSKIEVGSKVRLVTRPLPTLGYVRYMGPVEFDEGDWVGIELESRLGNNDGSVNGKRYFQTDPHRGTFVKKFELTTA